MKSSSWLIPALFLAALLQACSSKPLAPEAGQGPTVTGTTATDKSAPAKVLIDPAASARYQQALAAIDQGQQAQAVAMLTDMATRYPKFSGPHTNLGLVYLKQGDLTKAESAFKAALAINPGNAVAHNHLGIVYRQQGRFTDAEKAYLSAIQHKHDYANAHLNLAILYDIYLLKLNKALQHYQTFQSLQITEDATVKKWIIGLKRRIKVSK